VIIRRNIRRPLEINHVMPDYAKVCGLADPALMRWPQWQRGKAGESGISHKQESLTIVLLVLSLNQPRIDNAYHINKRVGRSICD
jgi:hypothetical protein